VKIGKVRESVVLGVCVCQSVMYVRLLAYVLCVIEVRPDRCRNPEIGATQAAGATPNCNRSSYTELEVRSTQVS
jgi:hypothetical protein